MGRTRAAGAATPIERTFAVGSAPMGRMCAAGVDRRGADEGRRFRPRWGGRGLNASCPVGANVDSGLQGRYFDSPGQSIASAWEPGLGTRPAKQAGAL